MQTNSNIEKVYELLEQFEFTELSEIDKRIVLSVMTESEYAKLRKTIDTVKNVLQNDIEPVKNIIDYSIPTHVKTLSRVFNLNLKLYQVAASIAILVMTFFLFQHSNKSNVNQKIAINDNTAIRYIDTVHTIVYDTIEIIKEKVQYIQPNSSKPEPKSMTSQASKKADCSNNICPNEIENITVMNSRNTISNDTTTKGLLLSLN
jgi:hypothetical protein